MHNMYMLLILPTLYGDSDEHVKENNRTKEFLHVTKKETLIYDSFRNKCVDIREGQKLYIHQQL